MCSWAVTNVSILWVMLKWGIRTAGAQRIVGNALPIYNSNLEKELLKYSVYTC